MLWLKIFFISLVALFSFPISSYSDEFCDSLETKSLTDENSVKEVFVIDEIRILGNHRTLPETILQEININDKQFLTEEDLKYFENRIFSLGIFSDVKVFLSKENDKNVLIILVQESWYIWPLPFVYFNDRDFKKISYGLNLGLQNISGRNDFFNTGFSLGFNPKFYLNYYNPNFDFQHKLIFLLKTQIQKRLNRSLEAQKFNNKNYSEKYFNFEIGLGKRLNIFNLFFASLGFEYIEPEEYFPLRTVATSGIDRAISFQINYSYDTRDFSAYPKTGTNFNLSYRKTGFGESPVNYNIVAIETKKIFSIGDPIIYLRNYSRFQLGPEFPFYANSFLGYGERLRGRFDEIFESHSMIFSNFEVRFPIFEKYLLKLNLPLIPEELQTYNLSIDFHTFFDNAFLFNKEQKFRDLRAINGFGFGFSFLILPYRSLNLEIAWNQNFKPQFIFDMNFPF